MRSSSIGSSNKIDPIRVTLGFGVNSVYVRPLL